MLKRQEGQAVVEAAVVLPAMIFLLLLTIQLTQLQQARIMAEYAAFTAARTGIVMNGNNGTGSGGLDGPMHSAAVLAILPTFGRTDSPSHITTTLAKFTAQDGLLKPFGLSQVRVFVHNPVARDFKTFGGHLNGQEIDFDDARPEANEAALLSLQVRYLYELRVPFANRMIQTIWLATKAGVLGTWGGFNWSSPRFGTQSGPDAVALSRAIASSITVKDGTPEGIPLAGLVAAGAANRFFLPVEAFYTMRMQSNPYLKWAHQ